jgi:hypothetical protein
MPTRRLEQLDAYARLLMRAGFTEDRAMDVLRAVYIRGLDGKDGEPGC